MHISHLRSAAEAMKSQCEHVGASSGPTSTWKAFIEFKERVQNFCALVPLLQQLAHPTMGANQWKQLLENIGKPREVDMMKIKLSDFVEMELYNYAAEITEVCDAAKNAS